MVVKGKEEWNYGSMPNICNMQSKAGEGLATFGKTKPFSDLFEILLETL